MTHSDFASCVREACAMFFILDFYIYGLLKACIYEMQIRYPSLSCMYIASSTVYAYILTLQSPFISKSESCLLRVKVKQIFLTKTRVIRTTVHRVSYSLSVGEHCFQMCTAGNSFPARIIAKPSHYGRKKSITM